MFQFSGFAGTVPMDSALANSGIPGSTLVCQLPRAFRRLPTPFIAFRRQDHPPCALSSLTTLIHRSPPPNDSRPTRNMRTPRFLPARLGNEPAARQRYSPCESADEPCKKPAVSLGATRTLKRSPQASLRVDAIYRYITNLSKIDCRKDSCPKEQEPRSSAKVREKGASWPSGETTNLRLLGPPVNGAPANTNSPVGRSLAPPKAEFFPIRRGGSMPPSRAAGRHPAQTWFVVHSFTSAAECSRFLTSNTSELDIK